MGRDRCLAPSPVDDEPVLVVRGMAMKHRRKERLGFERPALTTEATEAVLEKRDTKDAKKEGDEHGR